MTLVKPPVTVTAAVPSGTTAHQLHRRVRTLNLESWLLQGHRALRVVAVQGRVATVEFHDSLALTAWRNIERERGIRR